jgi:hypothetical protein
MGVRFFGGLSTSGDDPVKQRQIYAAGQDPLEQLNNPFLRSNGALLVRPDVFYHAAGGGDLRGFDPHLSAQGLVAINLELERAVVNRPKARLFRETSVVTRADFPLFVNQPALAQDTHPGSDRAGFRWSFSFTPAF